MRSGALVWLLLLGCVAEPGKRSAPAVVDLVPVDAGNQRDEHCFTWRGSTYAGFVSDEYLVVKGLGRAGTEWFELKLHDGRTLLGRKRSTELPGDLEQFATEGLSLLLPRKRRDVLLNETGGGINCPNRPPNRDLGGPFAARKLDASRGWQFVVQDSDGKDLFEF